MSVYLEFFYAPYCPRCESARVRMQSLAAGWSQDRVQVCEINVLENLDRAVTLGVLQTPAIAIDGKLIGSGITSPKALEKLLREQLPRVGAK